MTPPDAKVARKTGVSNKSTSRRTASVDFPYQGVTWPYTYPPNMSGD